MMAQEFRMLTEIRTIARDAGATILRYYRSGDLAVDAKSDGTPVLGVVCVPPLDLMYFAEAARGTWKQVLGAPMIHLAKGSTLPSERE
jgi:3'-phosphoadenosine 5'-phosphosulfate (PAPS) 3'-phosphatase